MQGRVTLTVRNYHNGERRFIHLLTGGNVSTIFHRGSRKHVCKTAFVSRGGHRICGNSQLNGRFSTGTFRQLFGGPSGVPGISTRVPSVNLRDKFSSSVRDTVRRTFNVFTVRRGNPSPRRRTLTQELRHGGGGGHHSHKVSWLPVFLVLGLIRCTAKE